MSNKWAVVFGAILLVLIVRYVTLYGLPFNPGPAALAPGVKIGGSESLEPITSLNLTWESGAAGSHTTKPGEICYGDSVSFDGKTLEYKVVNFASAKQLTVVYGGCTTDSDYGVFQIRDFLKTKYPNRPGNWEQVVEVP